MASATLSELIGGLHGGRRLVLPNARAARELRVAFDAEQRLCGCVAWEPPQVFSWAQWTSSLWNELVVEGAERRLLLNSAQEHSLWCEVLRDSAESDLLSPVASLGRVDSLGSVDSLAELAMSAWRLAAGYRAEHRLSELAVTNDCRVFGEWAEEFSRRCTMREYLSGVLLDAALLQHVQAGSLPAPASLELVGFGERLPAQDALIQGLRERGTFVGEVSLQLGDGVRRSAVQIVAANEKDELGLAVQWVHDFLQRSAAAAGRDARVAMLVPSLQEECADLEEVLRETLAPELQWIGADLSSTPWEISGGVPLASLAMVADALAVGRWAQGPMSVARVSSLLLSPYVGDNGTDEEARDASARFDAGGLRRLLLLRPEIGMGSLIGVADSVAQRHGADALDQHTGMGWVRSVHRTLQATRDLTRTRSFAAWMEFVRRLMQAANWPGTRPLNATEFETNRAWESLLDRVSTLDFSGRRVLFAEALETLELQAQKTIFAAPSACAPLQVMNVAEAEGCVFDAVVLLRCTDANWPLAERTNPLLPWSLQRSLKMPGTDPAHSSARSRAIMEDLMQRSGSVLFTRAAEDGSGKLRASPLLEEFEVAHADAKDVVDVRHVAEPVLVEEYIDGDGLPPLPVGTVRGGSAVLKLQAACGFLAFAQMRLRATEPVLGDFGLDALEGGNLLHRTMQFFWKNVGSQEALRRLTFAEREEVLSAAIDEAVRARLHPRDDWDHAYLALQKKRLCTVLQCWLGEELRRGPFSVLDVEQKQLLTVGPLTLEVRMDRIDRVGDGVLFVDYKTSYAADPKHWDGPRPNDPQLPLYALLPEAGELKGLAFAKIRMGRTMQWLGYQTEEGVLPKAKVRDFAALIEEWRGTLTQLAEDFAAGRADVNPKEYAINCSRCAQRLLCRVDRHSLEAEAEDEQEETECIDG